MDKMDKEGLDLTKMNIEKLKALFPECVSDGKVDFEVLRAILGDQIETAAEKYSFQWVGKNDALKYAQTPSTGTLIPCKEKSKDWDKTENLYIEGDNLEVLKTLVKTYHGKIKMIYIDPPYNTGNDFVYHDDFSNTNSVYEDISNQKYKSNPETSGKYHTNWLNLVYPRLKIAKELLSEEGVIFISIDDNELANLRKVCDEVFGNENFITMFIWEKTQHFGRQKHNYYSNADYILCYANNLISDKMKELLVESVNTELQDAPLFNASNNSNVLEFPTGSVKFNMDDGVYEKTTSSDYELLSPVTIENGKNKDAFRLKFRSRWSNATVQEEVKNGTTFWVKTTSFAIRAIYGEGRSATVAPRQIIFTNTGNPAVVKSRYAERIDTSENATSKLEILMGKQVFSYPKPVSLIKYFISMLYDYEQDRFAQDFTVLDFFSGSGTTAEAVMEMNATDGGSRKFILIQLPENLDENLKYALNQASKEIIMNAISLCDELGYKHLLTEIGEERLRRAAKKIYDELKEKKDNAGIFENEVPDPDSLDLGFKVFRLDSTNIRPWDATTQYDEQSIFTLNEVLKEGRTNLDVAYEVMLKYGVFNMPMEEITVNGKTVYSVGGGYMIISLNDQITTDDVAEIAKLKPKAVVFKESGFKDDNAKMNADYTFKRMGIDNVKCI